MIKLHDIFTAWYARFWGGIIIVIAFMTATVFYPDFIALFVAGIIASMIAIEYMRGGSVATFGFAFDKWTIRELLGGISAGVIPIALLLGMFSMVGWFSYSLNGDIPWSMLGMICMLAILEEIIFRGMIFQALIARFSLISVTIGTSLLFMAAHGANPEVSVIALINTFVANCVFIAAWYHTKGLWWPIAFHCSWNCAQVFSGQVLSGGNFGNGYVLSQFSSAIPQPWLQSSYGIEGTVYCTLVLLILITLIFRQSTSPFRSAAQFTLLYPKIEEHSV